VKYLQYSYEKNHSHIFQHCLQLQPSGQLVSNQRTTAVNANVFLEVESHTYSHKSYTDRI